jgi:hypothetical protein
MSNIAPIAMPGADSNRTDKGLLARVQRVQRDAKIQNASGGTYNERNTLNQLASGASTDANAEQSSVAMPLGNGIPASNPAIQSETAFTPTDGSQPITSGVPYGGGPGPESLMPPVDTVDNGEILARAMYLANPTPQNRLLVEAYNEARG